MTTQQMLVRAKDASYETPKLTEETKNAALYKTAELIEARAEEILAANKADTEAAQGKLSASMLDRRGDNIRKPPERNVRRGGSLPQIVERLRSAERKRLLRHGEGDSRGDARRTAPVRLAGGSHKHSSRRFAAERRRAYDGERLCRRAYTARRQWTYTKLS